VRILADANVESALVTWLRGSGNDVLWALELPPGVPDSELLRIAKEEDRILLTHDHDFGELVFRRGMNAAGVILMRFHPPGQHERLRLLQYWWNDIGELMHNPCFIVVRSDGLRARPLAT